MLPPLVFAPLYRRYLWGGRRFATVLGRDLPPGADYAESWEVVDRGIDQSVVTAGPLAGVTLGSLARERGPELLGRHACQAAFPLLFKFLDACRDLSVQVHPDDARASRLPTPDRGKTEAWYIVDALPGSRIYAGTRPGIDAAALAAAVRDGRCADAIHSFVATPGDCVHVPAGTIHALGAGLLVAEIQQSSDVTYRLHDWNRVGADGRARPLHVAEGLEAVTRFGPVDPVPRVSPAAGEHVLVRNDHFVLAEVRPDGTWRVGGDDGCHLLVVLDGSIRLDDSVGLPELVRGRCVLLPASAGSRRVESLPGPRPLLLHVSLP